MLITVDGKIFTDNGILNFPDIFKQVLSVFKHLEIKSFKFDQKELSVEFQTAILVDKYEPQLKAFTGFAELKLSPLELIIKASNTEKKTILSDSQEQAKHVADAVSAKLKEDIKSETIKPKEATPKFNPEEYISEEEFKDEDISELNVDKKLKNIKPGYYKVSFDADKYGWVLIYTQTGKRIPVKKSGLYVHIFELAKSISPIANTTKK